VRRIDFLFQFCHHLAVGHFFRLLLSRRARTTGTGSRSSS
jgi:hypothetical protein